MSRPAPCCRRCGMVIQRGYLFCRRHWMAIPIRLRVLIKTRNSKQARRVREMHLREADRLLCADELAEIAE